TACSYARNGTTRPLPVELLGTAHGRVVRLAPLNDLNAVSVGVRDEETVGTRNRRRLLNGHAAALEERAGGGTVRHAQGEVPRTDRVRPVLKEQVQMRVAQLEPGHLEVKRARPGNLAQAEQVAVEAPASFQVGDDHRAVAQLSNLPIVSHVTRSFW